MDGILQTLSESIGIWGYIVLFFYSLGGGYVAILAAGILSSGVIESLSDLNIIYSILIAGVANFIGSSGLFWLARYQKQEVMRYLKKHRRKIALSHIWIKKYDFWIIFIQKYLYGIKTLIPLVIGFSKYKMNRFVIYNFFASMLWALLAGSVAYVAGGSVKKIFDSSNPYIFPIVGACVFVILFLLFRMAYKKASKKN